MVSYDVRNSTQLQSACMAALGGDLINVYAGEYKTPSLLSDKHGSLTAPIIFRFVGDGWIDGKTLGDYRWRMPYNNNDRAPWESSPPRPKSSDFSLLKIINSNHICIQGLKVRGCWPTIFYIENSTHIAIQDCVLEGGTYAVFAAGGTTSYLLIDGNSWQQDTSLDHDLWKRIDWKEAHGGEGAGGTFRQFNGGFLSTRRIAGHVVVSNNRICDAYNGVRMKGDPAVPDGNAHIHIFNNHFLRIRDNPIELEAQATDWHVRHNRLLDCHSWFSVDGAAGGLWYFYGNLGSFASRQGRAPMAGGDPAAPHTMGRVLKLSYRANKAGKPDPETSSSATPSLAWYVAHNSFDLRCPIIGGSSPTDPADGEGPDFTANLTFAANAFSFASSPSADGWTVVSVDPRNGSPILPIQNFDFGSSSNVVFDGNLWHSADGWPDYRSATHGAPPYFENKGAVAEGPLFSPGTHQAIFATDAIRAFRLTPSAATAAEPLAIIAPGGDKVSIARCSNGHVFRGAVQNYGLASIPEMEQRAEIITANIIGQ